MSGWLLRKFHFFFHSLIDRYLFEALVSHFSILLLAWFDVRQLAKPKQKQITCSNRKASSLEPVLVNENTIPKQKIQSNALSPSGQ